jgi:hypothetical protein
VSTQSDRAFTRQQEQYYQLWPAASASPMGATGLPLPCSFDWKLKPFFLSFIVLEYARRPMI